MYRNSASTYVMHHALPSPDYTGDSDSDSEILRELEQKRRQLDEDIARFKAQKDKEFKDFEVELKSTRRSKRVQSHQNQSDCSYHEFSKPSPSTTPPYKFSASPYSKRDRPNQPHHVRQSSASMLLMKPTAGPKATTPTISLDHTNIRGETVQHSHALPTPPTPSAIPSSTMQEVISTIDQSKPQVKPPVFPEGTNEDAFSGVFVPSYLPLLSSTGDQKSDQSSDNLEGIQTEPASPTDRLTIDSMSEHASSLPLESSIPKSFQTSKRSYTSPSTTNRSTLAPIIRSASGKKRSSGKRKHVTFQLADRAIVEPSSSYEEGPSPDLDEKESNDSPNSTTPENGSPRPPITRRSTPLDPFGRRKKSTKPQETSPDEIGMGMGDLFLTTSKEESGFLTADDIKEAQLPSINIEPAEGYFSPRHGTTSTEPMVQKVDASKDKITDPLHSSTEVDEDTYLRKRKELLNRQRNSATKARDDQSTDASPLPRRSTTRLSPTSGVLPQQHLPSVSLPAPVNDVTNIGFFELDEELASPDSGTSKPYELATTDEAEDLVHTNSRRKAKVSDHPSDQLTGTSVPIDIVRPGNSFVSNSWMGTFGH